MSAYVITYYKRSQSEPVKTRRVEGLELSSVQVMADEWREWTNGYAVIEVAPTVEVQGDPDPSPAGIVDHRGQRHLVTIEGERHDFWTAAGELKGRCICGWVDYQTYQPGGENYARLQLQYRATDHLPRTAKQRRNACHTPTSYRPTTTTSAVRPKRMELSTPPVALPGDSPQPASSIPRPGSSDWSSRPKRPSPATAA